MKMKLAVGDPDVVVNGLGAGKDFETELFFAQVLQGEKGDPGEPGPKGDPGIQGEKGEKGAPGESSGRELVIPIDLRLPYEEREAGILATIQPLIDDGTFGSKILFGEYIWKKDYTAPDAMVYRVTVPAVVVDGAGVLKYAFGNSIEKHYIDDPDYPYRIESVISIRSSNNKITYSEQEYQYTDLQVIATENRMFEGTPEGESVIFTTAQISGLRRVASGLEKGCDVALYYRTDAGLISGYFEREKGTVDTTKFVFVTGCQWISANEAGELVFHSYKVVSDECNGTANSLFTTNGMCYRTDVVIPKSV